MIFFFIDVRHVAVAIDEGELPHTPTGPGATGSSESDCDDTPLPPTTEEGSSQEDDLMNTSTASSLDDELLTTPTPHPPEEEEACPSGTGSSNTLDGKSNAATKDFLKAVFSKNNNFTTEDIAKKAPAVTSLIPARNSPRKIETREVGLVIFYILVYVLRMPAQYLLILTGYM